MRRQRVACVDRSVGVKGTVRASGKEMLISPALCYPELAGLARQILAKDVESLDQLED